MRERRRFKRYHIAIDAAYMKVQGLGSIKSLTTIEDISLGGICAKMSRMVTRGDELLLELQPDSEESLLALAKVKWVLKGEKPESNKYGLEFQWISSKALLNDYLLSIDNAVVV